MELWGQKSTVGTVETEAGKEVVTGGKKVGEIVGEKGRD